MGSMWNFVKIKPYVIITLCNNILSIQIIKTFGEVRKKEICKKLAW